MKSICHLAVLIVAVGWVVEPGVAASPESIEQGRQLFEQTWSPRSPSLGSDRLGPLFNAKSCVACHHQGGVGGGGDSRFNARSIGIESISSANDTITAAELRRCLQKFYPGFIQPDGSFLNTATLPHHSTSPGFETLRQRLLDSAGAETSDEGGPVNADELRRTSDTPIVISHDDGGNQIVVKARLFERNTTPLFGAGLIDAVGDDVILRQAKLQEQHPEVSGRPSVLRDGEIGRFGWRGNVSRLVQFVDRACANELGLETKRRRQPADPMRPHYRNPAVDIGDSQIESMSEFLASLPAPTREIPEDSYQREQVARGEELFTAVDCAVCHVPKLGPASGIYSDLLLHDMGPYLFDFDAAEPHVVRLQFTRRVRMVPGTTVVSYYGTPTAIPAVTGGYFESPRASTVTRDYVRYETVRELGTRTINRSPNGAARVTAEFRDERGWERRLQPSNTAQEWRTPPLWGLRDSAPYLHDGRAETVLEAISMHEGESAGSRDRFLNLPLADRQAILAFLDTLVAPPNVPQPSI